MGSNIERALNALNFYSKAAEVAGAQKQKMPPEQLLAKLKGSGVKATELRNSNFENEMTGIRSITPGDARDFFNSKLPNVSEEVRRPEEHSEGRTRPSPNFESYTLPGGKDYEERVLKLPAIQKQSGWNVEYAKPNAQGEDYVRSTQIDDDPYYVRQGRPGPVEDFVNNLNQSHGDQYRVRSVAPHMVDDREKNYIYEPHWQSTPNVVGHLRMKMREGANPDQRDLFRPQFGKTLNIEEAQNDWGQQARTKGIRGDAQQIQQAQERLEAMRNEYRNADNAYYDAVSDEDRIAARAAKREAAERYTQAQNDHAKLANGVIAPPEFVGDTESWTNMLLRRALTVAAQKGAEGVQITGGDNQSKRWSGQDGVKSFYDNTVAPNMQRIVRSVDPTSRRMDLPLVDKMPGDPSSRPRMLHVFDQDGYHQNSRGPFNTQEELDRARQHYAASYPDWTFHDVPAGESSGSGNADQGNNPFFSLSSEARDKILKEGFPFFARGGEVGHHDDVDAIIAEAHEIARQNPDLVRKALAIVQAHAEQGDKQ